MSVTVVGLLLHENRAISTLPPSVAMFLFVMDAILTAPSRVVSFSVETLRVTCPVVPVR